MNSVPSILISGTLAGKRHSLMYSDMFFVLPERFARYSPNPKVRVLWRCQEFLLECHIGRFTSPVSCRCFNCGQLGHCIWRTTKLQLYYMSICHDESWVCRRKPQQKRNPVSKRRKYRMRVSSCLLPIPRSGSGAGFPETISLPHARKAGEEKKTVFAVTRSGGEEPSFPPRTPIISGGDPATMPVTTLPTGSTLILRSGDQTPSLSSLCHVCLDLPVSLAGVPVVSHSAVVEQCPVCLDLAISTRGHRGFCGGAVPSPRRTVAQQHVYPPVIITKRVSRAPLQMFCENTRKPSRGLITCSDTRERFLSFYLSLMMIKQLLY